MRRRELLKLSLLAAALPAFSLKAQESLDSLAREAFIYLYPMVKNYLTLYQYAIELGGTQYKGRINTLNSVARVYTPADTGIITPNSDTPYSFLVMDLRTEPLVVTLPKIDEGRYYSMQLVDLYTHNVGYLGTREDGNGGGDFLIAGPDWQGAIPKGVKRVVRMTTELGLGIIRTQLFSSNDLEEVKRIQAGYKVQLLSAYAATPAPVSAPAVVWPVISELQMVTDFWPLAAFLLQFAPALPGDEALRAQFSRLGLQAGAHWPTAGFDSALQVESAGVSAQQKLAANVLKLKTSAGLFGSPQEMRGRFMERAMGAMAGIYGNSVQEALYPTYLVDSDGNPLDTSKKRYALRFIKGNLPPVEAFWSITMYDGVARLLVRNALNRYLINSSMLPELKVDDNGDIVIYLQHSSPGETLESNWLPAPAGPMGVVMRLYLPKASALDGRWQPPVIETLS